MPILRSTICKQTHSMSAGVDYAQMLGLHIRKLYIKIKKMAYTIHASTLLIAPSASEQQDLINVIMIKNSIQQNEIRLLSLLPVCTPTYLKVGQIFLQSVIYQRQASVTQNHVDFGFAVCNAFFQSRNGVACNAYEFCFSSSYCFFKNWQRFVDDYVE